jgi:DNA polymerase-3 subunit epsilon
VTWPSTFVGFDLETTGISPSSDRIVSAAVVAMSQDSILAAHSWLVNPGIAIPAEATAVHGITNERVAAEGQAAAGAVQEIVTQLRAAWDNGLPVVAYNAAFDIPFIWHEADRHGVEFGAMGVVLDPLVIWRQLERYRPGKKRLADAVSRFGLSVEDAHEAMADAKAAVEVMFNLVELGSLGDVALDEMMVSQASWHREWAVDFKAWLEERGKDASDISLTWPM